MTAIKLTPAQVKALMWPHNPLLDFFDSRYSFRRDAPMETVLVQLQAKGLVERRGVQWRLTPAGIAERKRREG
jgi:hypothetical protein